MAGRGDGTMRRLGEGAKRRWPSGRRHTVTRHGQNVHGGSESFPLSRRQIGRASHYAIPALDNSSFSRSENDNPSAFSRAADDIFFQVFCRIVTILSGSVLSISSPS